MCIYIYAYTYWVSAGGTANRKLSIGLIPDPNTKPFDARSGEADGGEHQLFARNNLRARDMWVVPKIRVPLWYC